MKYNASDYNIIIEENEDYVYLYNSFSGAFAKLEKEIYNSIASTVIDDAYPCSYFNDLQEQGFIKPVDLDEYNKIITTERYAMYEDGRSGVSFVIAPTMSCNLSCKYCFEKKYIDNSFMSDNTVDAVVDYIDARIKKEKIKRISVLWFGGEPLLAYDVIVAFSKKINSIIQKNDVTYSSSMITNGILLTEEKAEYLAKNCGLKKVQITIDGTESIYCQQKGASAEQYKAVLNNINNALNYMKVAVRFNCGKNNYPDIISAAEYIVSLCGQHKNLSFYLAKVADYGCDDSNELCFQEEFDEKVINFNQVSCSLLGREYKPTIPTRRKIFCGLFKLKNVVIDPNGELYKCEHHLGRHDKVIGNVRQGIFYSAATLKFINNDVNEKCSKCKLFPLCLGGCPAQREDLYSGEACCFSLRYLQNLLQKKIKYN